MAARENIEQWALAYLAADTFEQKLAPPPCPANFAPTWSADRSPRPGRGPEFRRSERGEKSTGKSQLLGEERRARLLHTFLHHELQAAELFAWALVAFPGAPLAMRQGFLKILHEEIRHMNLYADLLRARGFEPGAFEVRDWFWERVPSTRSEVEFAATLGIGFEGGNLDHASRFARRFVQAKDLEGGRVQAIVAREEVLHVKFALTWFRELSPELAAGHTLFEAFRRSLPPPLSPILMRGVPSDRELRKKAGFDDAFIDSLTAFDGDPMPS